MKLHETPLISKAVVNGQLRPGHVDIDDETPEGDIHDTWKAKLEWCKQNSGPCSGEGI